MAEFTYKARNKEGQEVSSSTFAASKQELATLLGQQGLILTEAKLKKGSGDGLFDKIGEMFGRISLLHKILFTRNLQVMLKAGLPIVRALSILEKQTTSKKFKKILAEVKDSVEKGNTLSESLGKYPKIFSPLYVSTVKMAEESGNLEKILNDLADQMKKDRDLINKVRTALIYPILILVVMVVVGAMMIVFVLPQLVDTLTEVEVDLPITTKILIAFSDFVQGYGIFIVVGVVIISVAVVMYWRTKGGKKRIHKLLIIMPVAGKIIKKINLARFSRSESTLLKSGINIVKSLQITKDILGNIVFKESMQTAAEKMKKGQRMADALNEYSKIYPPLVTQMVVVGEETGTLDEILKELADFYEEEVSRTMDNLSSIIEPVLMIILGFVVAVLAMAIYSPIYSMVESI